MFYSKANSINTYKKVAIILRKKVSGKTSIQTQFNLYGNLPSFLNFTTTCPTFVTVSQRKKLLVRQEHSARSVLFFTMRRSHTKALQPHRLPSTARI